MSGTKSTLRQSARQRIKSLPVDHRIAASLQARRLLEQQPAWKNAASIFFYAPVADEPDVWPLVEDSLAAGKLVCLPHFDATAQKYTARRIQNLAADLTTGQFEIREPAIHCAPVALNQLDLVLVPGVAFDRHGRRLGRGKGFYDRLLAEAGGIKCGVAFDEQIVTEIPIEPHDVLVDCILTPTRWIDCDSRRF